MTKRKWQYLGGGLLVALLAIQLVPGETATNPPVEEEISAPAEVMQVLQRSCYDCHSNETTWPWYSHVAPARWLVRGHVNHAREDLNFSAMNRFSPEDLPHKLEEVAEEVEEGHMPLRSYLLMHRDARLSDAERELLVEWASRAALEAMPGGPEPGAEADAEPEPPDVDG